MRPESSSKHEASPCCHWCSSRVTAPVAASAISVYYANLRGGCSFGWGSAFVGVGRRNGKSSAEERRGEARGHCCRSLKGNGSQSYPAMSPKGSCCGGYCDGDVWMPGRSRKDARGM